MKTKKIIVQIIAVLVVFITHASYAQQSPEATSREGLQVSILAQTLFGGGTVGLYGEITYEYDAVKFNQTPSNNLEGIAGLSIGITDNLMFTLGGGYKKNMTFERGQPVGAISLQSDLISVSGKLLFSQYEEYHNNYDFSVMFYPGRDVFGVGVFYNSEYNCNTVGLKIGLHFLEDCGGCH